MGRASVVGAAALVTALCCCAAAEVPEAEGPGPVGAAEEAEAQQRRDAPAAATAAAAAAAEWGFAGVFAFGGSAAVVVDEDELPHLPPVAPGFSAGAAVWVDGGAASSSTFWALWWKGTTNAHRTPSAWLIGGGRRVTFRVSTQGQPEAWGTGSAELPLRRWAHVCVVAEGRLLTLYVDGVADAAIRLDADIVASPGPLWLGKDDSKRDGLRGFLSGFFLRNASLTAAEVRERAIDALAAVPPLPDDSPDPDEPEVVKRGEGPDARADEGVRPDGEDVGSGTDAAVDDATESTALDVVQEEVEQQEAREVRAERLFNESQELVIAGRAGDAGTRNNASRRALELRTEAARLGHRAAKFTIGVQHVTGYSTGAPDDGRAVLWYLRAAGDGFHRAQLALGWRHFHGFGVPKCEEVALRYLELAAETAYDIYRQPGKQTLFERVRLSPDLALTRADHRGEGDDRNAYLINAASLGNTNAQLMLANRYFFGTHGLERDLGRAFELYDQAHGAGRVEGTIGTAKMLLKGEGVEQNYTRSLARYNAAAEQDNAEALNGLGFLSYNGDGPMAKDRGAALEYFKRAAKLGSRDGAVNAGLILREGYKLGDNSTVESNYTAAYEYFRACADLGHYVCIYNAAKQEAKGRGCVRNRQLAIRRYLAVAQVGPWAKALGRGVNDFLAGDLDSAARYYDVMAELGYDIALYNAGYVHDQMLREARVAGAPPPATSLALVRRHWERLAVTAGETADGAMAQRQVGDCHLHGAAHGCAGAAHNASVALGWLRQAADAGDAEAHFRIGQIYLSPPPGSGVAYDPAEAVLSFRRARESRGNLVACALAEWWATLVGFFASPAGAPPTTPPPPAVEQGASAQAYL